MNKISREFAGNLEKLELTKLKEKYKSLGYVFPKPKQTQGLIVDVYAINKKTKDEIVFEIKALGSIKKGDTKILVDRRKKVQEHYPGARFVLVLAKENKESEVTESPTLNRLILDYINSQKKKEIKKQIPALENLDSVEKLSIDKFNFKDFQTIEISGYANLLFYHKMNTREVKGTVLSDGITFHFKIKLVHSKADKRIPYHIHENSKIDFDYSEFM